jgi:hypothetical protein
MTATKSFYNSLMTSQVRVSEERKLKPQKRVKTMMVERAKKVKQREKRKNDFIKKLL